MLRLLLVFLVAAGAAAEKPALVFSGPSSCPAGRIDRCKDFLAMMQHPAVARRLHAIDFRVEAAQEEKASLAVYDAKGDLVVRWHAVPHDQLLGRILNMLDGAMPYLDGTDPYDPPLAALALGNAARGRALLEQFRGAAGDAEARELATIWLGKLDDRKEKRADHPAAVAALAKNGATARVRFEAWMEAARLHAASERMADAAKAVEAAAEAATSLEQRKIALLARQHLEERRSPLFGLAQAGELVYGRRTLQPRAVPKNAARVELRLDGKLAGTAKRAPFATTINFGRIPRRQVLEYAVLDRGGKVLQQAAVVVNERRGASSIEILEPPPVPEPRSEMAVAVRAPRGAVAEEVRFEWNGTTIARFTAPPYRAPLRIAEGEPGVLRAVARFDDGTEVEDARLLNAGGGTLTSDVHLVELPVYFESRIPAEGELRIREEGKPRRVERIVPAPEAPLRVALVLDASSSMAPHMFDLQEASLRFVEQNLDARDEAMIAGFGSTVDVLRPTRDRAALERFVLGLRAAGLTPLYDAMVRALLDLQVGGSRRALVVFSDGVDTSSVFRATDVQEVARRVGVPIYALSFVPPSEAEPLQPRRTQPSRGDLLRGAQRELAALADRSGGKAFVLHSLGALGGIWNEIGADLRKQSLVLFRTDPGAGDEWRSLDVSTSGGALRAPAGVYVTGRGAE